MSWNNKNVQMDIHAPSGGWPERSVNRQRPGQRMEHSYERKRYGMAAVFILGVLCIGYFILYITAVDMTNNSHGSGC